MDKKKNEVDYAAAYRQFMNFGHGRSLKQQLKDSQISEEEKGILARWWQRRNWRKNSERKVILNGRNPKNRQERKDHMCDGSDDDITHGRLQ